MLKRRIGDLIHNSTYNNDIEFWSNFSSITSGSPKDHMIEKLSGLGFSGTPHDRLSAWAKSRAATLIVNGSINDNLRAIFQDKTFLSNLMTSGL